MRQTAIQLVLTAALCAFGALPAAAGAELTIVSVEPTPRDLDAPAGSAVTVHFDRPVDRATVTALDSFWAFGRWSGTVDGVFSYTNADQSVTLTPSKPFSAGEQVMVILSHDLRGADGTPLRAAGYTFQFWVAAAPAPLAFVEIQRLTTRSNVAVSSRAYGGIGSDLNADGFLDITVVNEDTADLRVFMSEADGTGSYASFNQPTFAVGPRASPSEPTDFDRDGFVDICVANIDDNTVSVLLGNGDGTFAPQQLIAVGGSPRGIAVLDADGDGDIDIVNTNSAAAGDLSLLLNDGNGTFGAPLFFDSGVSGEWALAAGDMNEDGVLDLVSASRFAQQIVVMIGSGAASFATLWTQSSGGQTWVLVLGDVNGDGHEDVATVNSTSNTGSIIPGNGLGRLGPAITEITDPLALSTDLGDLDGDGDLDWVTSSFSGDWNLFTNDGDGRFTLNQQFPSTLAASCAVLLDIDDDEDLDLALIDELQDELIILSNGPPNECHVSDETDWYVDSDGDGYGDDADVISACSQPAGRVELGGDCDDSAAGIWAAPGEVIDLTIAGDSVTWSWSAPAEPGAASVSYDTLRSDDAASFVGAAVCVESAGTDMSTDDAGEPAPGGMWFYLVRAENGCVGGVGSLGNDSNGTARVGRDCP